MKICSLVLAIVLLTGCTVVDNPIFEQELNKLTKICNNNAGLKQAQKTMQLGDKKWRATCKDGAEFIFNGI